MSKHILGYSGHRRFKPYQLKALDRIDARINHWGKDQYHLIIDRDDVSLDRHCPSYITHDNGVFDQQNLMALMDWLHQPSASYYQTLSQDKKGKAAALEIKKNREAMLSFMNFALTGRAQLQDKIRENLKKETAECHAGTEDAMRQNDEWVSECEIGNDEVFASALPGTTLLPQSGMQFDLSDDFLSDHDGQHQRFAKDIFWQAVNAATNNRYQNKPKSITLSAKELEKFYDTAHQQDLTALVPKVHFETMVQQKAGNIKQRMQALALSQAHDPAAQDPQNAKKDLYALLHSTTAFTPVMESEYLRGAWWRAHITESWFADKNDTPYEQMAEEYAVFTALMHSYSKQQTITPTQLQAITEEFYPLLAATEKAQDIIERAAKQAKTDIPETLSSFRQAFNKARYTDLPVANKFLPEHHRDALENLQHTLKSGPKAFLHSLTTDPLKGGARAGWNVTKDVWNYCAEDPKQAALVVSAGFALYFLSANTGVDAATLAANNDILLLTADGLSSTMAPDTLSAEAAQTQSYHYDVGFSLKNALMDLMQGDLASPYYVYKHFTNFMMIEGTEWSMETFEKAMQYTAEQMGLPGNDNTAFSMGAKSTMYGLASFYFSLNLFQNFSHTGFWSWAAKKGFTHGGKGALRIVELASPLINPFYQAGMNLIELTPFKKKPKLSERLEKITQPLKTEYKYEGRLNLDQGTNTGFNADVDIETNAAAISLAKAAQARTDLENTLPEAIKDAQISLKIGGLPVGKKRLGALTRDFTISAQNLKPTLTALDQFDHALEHMASYIGADEPWYNAYLKEKLENVTTALNTYRQNEDLPSLQSSLRDNLHDLISAQMRLSGGYSQIWDALSEGQEPDKKSRKKLIRSANETYGKLKRAHITRTLKHDKLTLDQTFTGHIKTNAKIAGMALWNGVVRAARSLQNLDNIIPPVPAAIATVGTAAACVALDMAGLGNSYTALGAQAAGIATSSTIMSGIFVGYNWFIDDVIFVHLSTGAGLMAGGIGLRMAYNQIKPALAATAESQTLRTLAKGTCNGLGPLTKPFALAATKTAELCRSGAAQLRASNERKGQKMTQTYRNKNKDLYSSLIRQQTAAPPQGAQGAQMAPAYMDINHDI